VRPPRPDRSAASEADERTVRTAALALLAGRDFGRQELAVRLTRKGYPRAHIAAVLDQLTAAKLLSEARFVEQFIRQHAARGQGPVRIRLELSQRGVEAEAVEEALAASGEDWVAAAREARRRKFGAALPGDFRQRAKQARFLQYRGYSAEQVRAALGPGDDAD
jgi:regulatory protein